MNFNSSRYRLVGYGLFDAATSCYVIAFSTFVFPLFYKELGSSESFKIGWGLLLTGAVVLSSLSLLLAGHLVTSKQRLAALTGFALTGLSGAISIGFGRFESKPLIAVFFLIMHASILAASALYDSMLVEWRASGERTKVSTWAWGIGYLAGALCLAAILFGEGKGFSTRTLLSIGASGFGLILTISLFLLWRSILSPAEGCNMNGIVSLNEDSQKNRGPWLFLIGMWFIAEGIAAIQYFTALYAKSELALNFQQIGRLFLLTQLLAAPLTILSGLLFAKMDRLKAVQATLYVWIIICGMLYWGKGESFLYLLAFATATVIGTTPALLRATQADYSRNETAALQFGVYSIIMRSGALFGPLLFSINAKSMGGRMAMALNGLFFALALLTFYLLQRYQRNSPPVSIPTGKY